jgi:hypothetical protein
MQMRRMKHKTQLLTPLDERAQQRHRVRAARERNRQPHAGLEQGSVERQALNGIASGLRLGQTGHERMIARRRRSARLSVLRRFFSSSTRSPASSRSDFKCQASNFRIAGRSPTTAQAVVIPSAVEGSALKIRLSHLDLTCQRPSNLYGLGWRKAPCMTAVAFGDVRILEDRSFRFAGHPPTTMLVGVLHNAERADSQERGFVPGFALSSTRANRPAPRPCGS